jgi:hypothetical protein
MNRVLCARVLLSLLQTTLGISGLITASSAYAAQVQVSAFSAAATVQGFESVGEVNHAAPFLIGSDLFDTDNHVVRASSKFGPLIGRSGVGISNDSEGSSAQFGFMDVQLGSPALRAGMYVGFESGWSADVSFYDTSNSLLGTLSFSANARENRFAGWQADAGLISRIHVTDKTPNNLFPIVVDDLIQEVPEPSSLLSVALLMGGLIIQRKRP